MKNPPYGKIFKDETSHGKPEYEFQINPFSITASIWESYKNFSFLMMY